MNHTEYTQRQRAQFTERTWLLSQNTQFTACLQHFLSLWNFFIKIFNQLRYQYGFLFRFYSVVLFCFFFFVKHHCRRVFKRFFFGLLSLSFVHSSVGEMWNSALSISCKKCAHVVVVYACKKVSFLSMNFLNSQQWKYVYFFLWPYTKPSATTRFGASKKERLKACAREREMGRWTPKPYTQYTWTESN